jgi:hypothetical protein
MKIAVFTPRSIEPLHPRLLLFKEYFSSKGISIDFINRSNYEAIGARINWLTLWFFDIYAIYKSKPFVKGYDIIFITDLRYLPLAKHAKRLNKVVIYDTIDHNVFLRFYSLEKKIKVIKFFKRFITSALTRAEKYYAKNYCNDVLVNSDSLFHYFERSATILYYSSPLELLSTNNNPINPIALLYLGAFSKEKGAVEIIELQQKMKIPLFIFGDIGDRGVHVSIQNNPLITHTSKISIDTLLNKLKELFKKYYLVGFSLIQPAHFSYEVQEANKDIDYLAMGIPIIGNNRKPTQEKIDAGCGLSISDPNLIQKINTQTLRESMTEICLVYYSKRYSSEHFTKNLDSVMNKYL